MDRNFPLGPDLTLRVLHAVLETRKEKAAQIAAMVWSRQPAREFARLPDTVKTRALEEPGFAHGLWQEAILRPADPVWKLILQDLDPKNVSALATRLRDHYHPAWPDPKGALLWLRIIGQLSIPEPGQAKAIADPIRHSARWKEVLAKIRPQLTTVAEDECGLELLDSGN